MGDGRVLLRLLLILIDNAIQYKFNKEPIRGGTNFVAIENEMLEAIRSRVQANNYGIAVDFLGIVPGLVQTAGQLAGGVLGVAEDDGQLGIVTLEKGHEQAEFVPRLGGQIRLMHFFHGQLIAPFTKGPSGLS